MSQFTPLRDGGTQLDVAVLDAAQRQSLLAVRALGLSGLKVGAFETHKNAPAFSSRWCETCGLLADFQVSPEAYVDGVMSLIDQYKPSLLIPTHDGAIDALDSRRHEIPTTTRLALPTSSALSIATDKVKTNAIATDLGIRIPRSVHISDPGQFGSAVLDEIGLPIVVKPIRSWVGEGCNAIRLQSKIATSKAAVDAEVRSALNQGAEVLLQEWIPGSREAVWLFYAQERVWAGFAQIAYRMKPVLGGSSVLRESIPLSRDTLSASGSLVSAVGIEGFSEIEFRRDRDGEAVLMEINPRLSASLEVAYRSGVDFLSLIYAWATGQRLWTINQYKNGVRMRWLGGDFLWLGETLRNQNTPDSLSRVRAMRVFVSDFSRRSGYDYLGFSDPKPAITASIGAIRSLLRLIRNH